MKSFGDQFFALVHREHHHFGERRAAAYLARGFDPVQRGQRNVDNGDVGLVLEGEFNGFATVLSLTADKKVARVSSNARRPRRTIS